MNAAARRATAIGFTAVLLWSALATLTAATGAVPAFQLTAMTMALGAAVGAATWLWRGIDADTFRQPPAAWLLGIVGLFGYHALYFLALRMAPPAEAGLFNYLWPLLIVLLSALLPGNPLRRHHVIGAIAGFIGTAVLLAGRDGISIDERYAAGYAAAVAAAFVWAGYSVLSRRFAAVPTDLVVVYCGVTALLAALCHLRFETTAWPQDAGQWTALLLLGIGPVGAAFYAWDHGVKRGDVRVLGAASYAAPILSTALLVLTGYAEPTATLAIAALLIAGGGLFAAKDLFRRAPATLTPTADERTAA